MWMNVILTQPIVTPTPNARMKMVASSVSVVLGSQEMVQFAVI